MSLGLVIGLLSGYTVIVFNSHSVVGMSQQTKERVRNNPSEPREPAAAQTEALRASSARAL
jgi:hypothetical protein